MKEIVYQASVLKTLRKMPVTTAKRIQSKIKAYAKNPASQANNVTKLQGYEDAIRLRVGDWRVIMVENTVITVVKIGSRGNIY